MREQDQEQGQPGTIWNVRGLVAYAVNLGVAFAVSQILHVEGALWWLVTSVVYLALQLPTLLLFERHDRREFYKEDQDA